MKIPTVKLRHTNGRIMIVNESDYASGAIPGVHIGSDWTRIGETHGDSNEAEAVAAGIGQRDMVDRQAKKAVKLEKKAK